MRLMTRLLHEKRRCESVSDPDESLPEELANTYEQPEQLFRQPLIFLNNGMVKKMS